MPTAGFLLCMLLMLVFTSGAPDLPPPPGTIRVDHNRYVDVNMISNADYFEYLYYIRQVSGQDIQAFVPADTTVTYKGKVIWRNPAFDEFPVVGLTDDQIEHYCRWRSERVNQLILNPTMRCSAPDQWAKHDALDPAKQYRVHYSLATRSDVLRPGIKVNRFHLNERVSDGIIARKRERSRLNPPELTGFRCRAVFVRE